MTEQSSVLVERHGHVMLITLNRPAVMNAVNSETSSMVGELLDEAEQDRGVRAVVLTGAGDRAFCAGADLAALSRGESLFASGRQWWGFAGYVSHPISKPTIAAVNGFALGGGTELALASDLVVAVESATFGLPEVKRGLFAAAGGVFRLPAQIPEKIALEMIYTGEPLDAYRAHSLGLVNRVVSDGAAVTTALALAERIAANAPLSVQASKRVAKGIVSGKVPGESDAWRRTELEARSVMVSADLREGTRAFIEKRQPEWSGE
ncbi:crotonase/enoyl-CoA hydratase family protein [Nocardia sp. NPDC005825]|uniref:crotonase/enoyl-CoA hydratase family protein n=1 Tax=unclassified Nocardia TaxID=2637762 RepID=UPI0033F6CE57